MLRTALFSASLILFLSLSPVRSALAAMELGNIPSSISTNQEIDVFVFLSSLSKEATYYLKGCFYQSTNNYFGLTWNGTEWVNNSESYTKQLAITTNSQGEASANLKVKVDTNDSGFSGPGSYSFKVARYTAAGSLSWSDSFPITITTQLLPPTPSNGNIILSEFMPNPASGDEWAEVYNPNDFEVEAGSWKIDDAQGSSSPFTVATGTRIAAHSFAVFSFSAKLNNSGDTIRLLDPNGTDVESYSFGETTKGVAFAKDSSGNWQLTTTPTPGTTNKITLPTSQNKTQAAKSNSVSKTNSQTDFNNLVSSHTPVSSSASAAPIDDGGKVDSISKEGSNNKSLTNLLIAAGLSFLTLAIAWPFLEKGLWKNQG